MNTFQPKQFSPSDRFYQGAKIGDIEDIHLHQGLGEQDFSAIYRFLKTGSGRDE